MSQRIRFFRLFLALVLVYASSQLCSAKEGSAKKGSAAKAGSSTKTGSGTKEGFVSLFNGKDLDGWIRRGGEAEYTIEGDAIVGTSRINTPNTFLCTPKLYSDFILEVDFKVDDGLNSGIQIRSNARPETDKRLGKIERVYGYQVEIDTSGRSWSAGIYEEAARGWLYKLEGDEHKAARQAIKHNDWNHYRIEAIGNSIKTWINGVPAADLKDDRTATGFIALQVHSIPNKLEGKQIRWRNIHLKEVTK